VKTSHTLGLPTIEKVSITKAVNIELKCKHSVNLFSSSSVCQNKTVCCYLSTRSERTKSFSQLFLQINLKNMMETTQKHTKKLIKMFKGNFKTNCSKQKKKQFQKMKQGSMACPLCCKIDQATDFHFYLFTSLPLFFSLSLLHTLSLTHIASFYRACALSS